MRSSLIVTEQVDPSSLSQPVHPPKTEPSFGEAVSETCVPSSYTSLQSLSSGFVLSHEIPSSELDTEPSPSPLVVTFSVCVGPELKLPPSRKTALSHPPSPTSAIASLAWFSTPGFTVAVQVSTTVRPSSSVLIVPPPSSRSLFR